MNLRRPRSGKDESHLSRTPMTKGSNGIDPREMKTEQKQTHRQVQLLVPMPQGLAATQSQSPALAEASASDPTDGLIPDSTGAPASESEDPNLSQQVPPASDTNAAGVDSAPLINQTQNQNTSSSSTVPTVATGTGTLSQPQQQEPTIPDSNVNAAALGTDLTDQLEPSTSTDNSFIAGLPPTVPASTNVNAPAVPSYGAPPTSVAQQQLNPIPANGLMATPSAESTPETTPGTTPSYGAPTSSMEQQQLNPAPANEQMPSYNAAPAPAPTQGSTPGTRPSYGTPTSSMAQQPFKPATTYGQKPPYHAVSQPGKSQGSTPGTTSGTQLPGPTPINKLPLDPSTHPRPAANPKNPNRPPVSPGTQSANTTKKAHCNRSSLAGKLYCRVSSNVSENPGVFLVLILMLAVLCYCRKCLFGSSEQDARGEYRSVAHHYAHSSFDDTFDDEVSNGENEGYNSGDEEEGGWSNGGNHVIEMKTLDSEQNGGLTLEEMNG